MANAVTAVRRRHSQPAATAPTRANVPGSGTGVTTKSLPVPPT